MSKKVIVFDLDGVIFDSTAIAKEHLLKSFPDMTDQIHKEILTGNFHEEIRKLNLRRVEETNEEKEKRKIWYSEQKAKSPVYEGMKELLGKLHSEGYIIVLNTSAYNRNCLPMLEGAGIENLFDFLCTAEISKSKTEKFQIIRDKYQVEQSKMLFVTDTLGDIREADVAGIPTVAVTWGAHDHSYFNREPHKNLLKIIDSVQELQSFIENH